jgi:P27 family predicted phage terminase small subunit
MRRNASSPRATKIKRGDKAGLYDPTGEDVPDVIKLSARDMEAPRGFTPEQIEVWDQLCESLGDRKILSPAFRLIMVSFCRAYAQWDKISREIEEDGELIIPDNPAAKPYAHPLLKAQQALAGQLIRYGREFGLSPYGNSCLRVHVEDKKEESTKSRFFA